MTKIKNLLVLLISILLLTYCDDNTNDIIFEDETVIINSNIYYETATNNYTITNLYVNNNLLTIKVASSGCDGESWKAVLIDANEILESYPVQRNIKLYLENNEACLAVFEREYTFDISVLREDFSEVLLNLDGWNTQIKI